MLCYAPQGDSIFYSPLKANELPSPKVNLLKTIELKTPRKASHIIDIEPFIQPNKVTVIHISPEPLPQSLKFELGRPLIFLRAICCIFFALKCILLQFTRATLAFELPSFLQQLLSFAPVGIVLCNSMLFCKASQSISRKQQCRIFFQSIFIPFCVFALLNVIVLQIIASLVNNEALLSPLECLERVFLGPLQEMYGAFFVSIVLFPVAFVAFNGFVRWEISTGASFYATFALIAFGIVANFLWFNELAKTLSVYFASFILGCFFCHYSWKNGKEFFKDSLNASIATLVFFACFYGSLLSFGAGNYFEAQESASSIFLSFAFPLSGCCFVLGHLYGWIGRKCLNKNAFNRIAKYPVGILLFVPLGCCFCSVTNWLAVPLVVCGVFLIKM